MVGTALTFDLNGDGAVARTNGDPILQFQIKNRDPHLHFDGNIHGSWRVGKYGRITAPATTPVGHYTLTYRARDNDGWSDWKTFELKVTQCHGCDCTLDDNNLNSHSPGVVIPPLDGATSNVSTCISGSSDDLSGNPWKKDYYHFTVQTDGLLNIQTSSPNSHKYHLTVKSSLHGTLYNSRAKTRNLNYELTAGEKIILLFKETGWDMDEYQANLTFTKIKRPPAVDIPDFVYHQGDPALNIKISDYTTRTDGDPILSYAWAAGKLPAGLHWSGGQSSPPASTVYEDAEDGNTAGWDIYDNIPPGASFSNVYDSDKGSRVIQLSGHSTSNGYRLRDATRHNWNNTTQHIFSWDMKFSSRFYIYVMVDTTRGFRYLVYNANLDQGVRGSSIYYKLGTGVQDGHWHTVTRDLESDLQIYQPGNHIRKVYGMLVRGSGRLDNIKLSNNPHLAGIGAFRGSPTEAGDFFISAGAKDVDGIGLDTFKLTVIVPVPPIASDVSRSILQGETLTWNLNGTGGITRTDGDPILQFETRNKDAALRFDGNTTFGTIGKRGTITVPSSISAGTHTMEFRARDKDGWSAWKTFTVVVRPVDTTSDICYNEPGYIHTLPGFPCRTDPDHGDFRGGRGCQQFINLQNNGSDTLTHVEVTIDQTPDNDVPMSNCIIQDGSGSTCESPSHYRWAGYDFNKGVKFVMPDFAPDANVTIGVETAVWTMPLDTRAIMDGTNLYIQYRDGSNDLHIAKLPSCAGLTDSAMNVDSNFTLIYGGAGTATLGDMYATGDSILYVNSQDHDDYSGPLDSATTHYMLTDSAFSAATDPSKRNASTAKLKLPPYVKAKHIKWAGLFWQGYVHEPVGAGQTLASVQAALDARNWNTVKIKTPDGTYTDITADPTVKDINNTAYYLLMVDHNSFRYFYSGYKNITDLVKRTFDDNGTHEFTVGNILTTAGTDYKDALYIPHANHNAGKWYTDAHGGGIKIGYFGGWSLVVVYDLIGTDEATTNGGNEAYKNVSLYNGYDFFMTWGDGDVDFKGDISLSGFKTPSNGRVKSKLLFFGGGGDKALTPDILQMQEKKTTAYADIYDGKNPSNDQFNSTHTVEGSELNPAKPNHQGMDLDVFDVSDHMDHKQSTTRIRFGVKKLHDPAHPGDPSLGTCDQVFPQVLGFSTELYVPKICYDFNVHNGPYYRLPVGDDRNFTTRKIADNRLIFSIMLKSEHADFDMQNTTGGIKFHNSPALTFEANSSLYSPPSINTYLPAIVSDDDSNFIAIGEDANGSGGTISSNEIHYAKFYYRFNDHNEISDRFDLEVHTSVQFAAGLNPIPFVLTTAGDSSSATHIDRCDINQTYDPVYQWFNIERADVTDSTPNTPKHRYPLYTHVAGRDFGVSIASYGGANFQTPKAYNSTVELEMINADTFANDSSNGYDSVCQDPDANAIFGEGKLWDFGNSGKTRITIPSFDTSMHQIDQTVTSRNAAYRVWVLTTRDANGTRHVISYHETNKRNFKHIYDTFYRNGEDNATHYCTGDCAVSGTTACYECIKKYFAVPVCSRDNFAIRPEGFRIEVSDTNNTTDINGSVIPVPVTNNETPHNVSLSAGYRYRLDGTAETFQYGGPSKGYTNIIAADNNTTDDYALLVFGDDARCADKTNHSQSITFANSTTVHTPSSIDNNNTGKYYYYVTDVNWTNVDRASYPYKTVFDPNCKRHPDRAECNDCLLHKKTAPSSGKVGCLTSSNINTDSHYNLIPLNFEPYKFEVTAVPTFVGSADMNETESNITRTVHYFFMNDFGYRQPGTVIDYFDPSVHPVTMAVTYKGDVTARGADGGQLSNFTDHCSASNVRLYVTFNDNNYTSNKYTMQYYLQTGDYNESFVSTINQEINATTSPTADDRNSSTGAPDIIIPASSFKDDHNGSVAILLHTTVKKPYRDLNSPQNSKKYPEINPVVLNFSKLTASDPDAHSHADMIPHHIPEGNNTFSAYVTYLYGKVTPGKLFYDNVTADNKTIALYVDVYCNPLSLEYGKSYLSTPTYGADEDKVNWHLADMFSPASIGTLDIQASHFGGVDTSDYNITILHTHQSGINALPGLLLNKDIQGNLHPAMQQGINIRPSGAGRPSIVQIPYAAPPWLVHDVGLRQVPRIRFIGGGSWNGVGDTGNVIRTRSGLPNVPRMNW